MVILNLTQLLATQFYNLAFKFWFRIVFKSFSVIFFNLSYSNPWAEREAYLFASFAFSILFFFRFWKRWVLNRQTGRAKFPVIRSKSCLILGFLLWVEDFLSLSNASGFAIVTFVFHNSASILFFHSVLTEPRIFLHICTHNRKPFLTKEFHLLINKWNTWKVTRHSPYHPYLPFLIFPPGFPLFCQLFYPVLLKNKIIYTENNGTYLLPKTHCRKGYSHQKQTVISHLHLNQTGNTESLFLLNMTWRLQIPWEKRIYSSIIFLPQTLSCKKKRPFIYKVNNKAKR